MGVGGKFAEKFYASGDPRKDNGEDAWLMVPAIRELAVPRTDARR
jgi:hypothetical protein